MSYHESESIELKENVTDTLKIEIIAFANADSDHFEAMRSLNQALTFDACTAEFAKRHIPFGPEQMQTLKLVDREGIYSNLGLLLSDQCTHSVKVAVFQGTTREGCWFSRDNTGYFSGSS